MPIEFWLTASACAASLIAFGGGLYEVSVVDPAWPARPDIIQPSRGGISRKWFWIVAHSAFELFLIGGLVLTWSRGDVRFWLGAAFLAHVVMRVWSALDFIPKALAFERAETVPKPQAEAWVRRSRWRLPLDLITVLTVAMALFLLVRRA